MKSLDIEFRDGRDNIMPTKSFSLLCDGGVNRLNIITGTPQDVVAMPGMGSQRMKALACLYYLNGAPTDELIRVVKEIRDGLLKKKPISPIHTLLKYNGVKSSCLLGVL